jgi:Cu/Ag efflux protein CusF
MKKVTAVLAVAILVVALGSLAFAAEAKKGTIKSVDAKAGTVVFCPEGTTTDMTLKAGKHVDLSKVKAGDKVEASIEKEMLMHVKEAPAAPAAAPAEPAAKKAPMGC